MVGRAGMVGTVGNGIVGKVGRVSSGSTLTWMSGDEVGVLMVMSTKPSIMSWRSSSDTQASTLNWGI